MNWKLSNDEMLPSKELPMFDHLYLCSCICLQMIAVIRYNYYLMFESLTTWIPLRLFI